MVTQSFLCKYKSKEVNITVEFPEQSDKEAEQDFIGRLKEIYLRKMEIKAILDGGKEA